MKARNAGLIRTLALAKRVRGVPRLSSLEHLAQEFNVCTRTIYRDLEALRDAGWNVPTFRYHPRVTKAA